MFKAKDRQSDCVINLLEPRWESQLTELRSRAHQDQLICPGCAQPVRVRVPISRRRHFAHKHLQNCRYGAQSPALLEARASLYTWLSGQAGLQVDIEKEIPELALPRPVDCWVECEQGPFAYWIIPTRLPPDQRQALRQAMQQLGVPIYWILLAELYRPVSEISSRYYRSDGGPDGLILSTTEREFARKTRYDENPGGLPGFSLQYLNPNTNTLTSYRGLVCVHEPQIYQGHCQQSPLAEIEFHAADGSLLHPGEAERSQRLHQQRQDREAAEIRRAAEIETALQHFFHGPADQPIPKPSRRPGTRRLSQPRQPGTEAKYLPAEPASPCEALCVFCGQLTRDYWYLNKADGTCKCRECYRAGKY